MERALVDIAIGEIALGGNMKFLEPQFPILTIHDWRILRIFFSI